jgi:hypothetical protein
VKDAKKNSEVAVSIDGATVGKSFNEGDELFSFIPLSHFEKLKKISESLSDGEKALLEEIKQVETIKEGE